MGSSIFTMHKDSTPFRRNEYDITAYVGKNGTGKTLIMVNDTIDTLKGVSWECSDPTHLHTQIGITSGLRNVLTTVPLLDPQTGQEHSLSRPYLHHSDFLVAEHSDVLLDEITAIFPSRGYGSLPPTVAVQLNQLRKPDVKVRWSAPSWARADVILREVTEQVVSTRRFASSFIPGRLRKTYSGFLVRSFSGDDFKTWVNLNMMIKIKPETYQFYWRSNKRASSLSSPPPLLSSSPLPFFDEAQNYYNSFAPAYVPSQDYGTGACLTCGGRRDSLKCLCSPSSILDEKLERARAFWSNQIF